ncbi:MAG: hypothetical protein U9Q81_26495 [Pseudomonadota bacterium]|nr:hypothetical protein [Pseudomonadota bacterium]
MLIFELASASAEGTSAPVAVDDSAALAALDKPCALAAIFDPDSPLATFQDFEIGVDPEDPDGDLIYASNVERGTPDGTDIYVMRLDGRTGMLSGSPRIIADNYTGRQKLNGPEFTFNPQSGLGVMLAGPGGVHAAWRRSPMAWDAFDFDLFGAPFPPLTPPPLPPTYPGRHPKDSHPFGLRAYSEIDFETYTCGEVCYAYLDDSTTTDLKVTLEAAGNFQLYRSTLHPVADGYAVFTGCRLPTAAPSDCGIFEVQIDGNGGVSWETFMQLYEQVRFPTQEYEKIQTAIHPVSGNLVVALLHGHTLAIWESGTPHAKLTLVDKLDNLPTGETETPSHLRLIEGPTVLYVQFFLRDGANMGSYVSVFDESFGPLQQIDARDPGGSELVYLPAADRLALFHGETASMPNGTEVQMVQRCWVDL